MAHSHQDRWSSLVDIKLRSTLILKSGVIFNTRYEGNPTAGAVKIPVRDTEVAIGDYSKTTGATMTHGDTAYITLTVGKDKAVNELIDGFDAAAVPDNLVADRLDSAGHSMALQMENDALSVLEAGATAMDSTVESTSATAYENVVDLRTRMSKAKIPEDGRRWLLVSPEFYALLLKDKDHFVKAADMGGNVTVTTGMVGSIAGFKVYELPALTAGIEFIGGHPNWCARVEEWAVPVHLQDLAGSGTFIGATAVQGRKVYDHKVTRSGVLFKKCFTPSDDTEIGAAVYSVTAPAKAATPQSTHAAGTGYTAAIAWSPTAVSFAASTAYTATVTYTAATGYKFAADFNATDFSGLPATGAGGTASSVTVTRVSDTSVTAVAKYNATAA